MKIRPVTAELFHADRRTDMKTLVVTFAILRTGLRSTFTNKNSLLVSSVIMVINFPQVTDRQIRHIMRSLHTANLMDRKNSIKQCNK